MRHCGFALLLTLALVSVGQAAEGIRWLPDLDSARRASNQFKVPLLIHFYGENCPRCKLLDTTVYSRPEVVETLNKYFVCVRVNAAENNKTAAEYQVHSWPTDVFLGSEAEVLQQGTCPTEFNDYMKTLEIVALRNRDRNIQIAAQVAGQPLPGSPASPPPVSLSTPSQQRGVYTNHKPFQAELAAYQSETQPPQNAGTPGQAAAPAKPAVTLGTPQMESIAPADSVASGPLAAKNQPGATRFATQGAEQQIGVPATPVSNAAVPGQLPERDLVGQVPNQGSAQAGRGNSPAAYPGMPVVTQGSQQTPQRNSSAFGASPATQTSSGPSEFVTNPYYRPSANASQQSSETLAATTTVTPPTQTTAAANSQTQNASQAAAMPTVSGLPSQEAAKRGSGTPALTQASFSKTAPTAAANTAEAQSKKQASGTNAAAQAETEPALEGYCPIALKQGGNWVAGKRQFAVKHRGKVYWLSTEEARAAFLADPDGSSPLLSGYDPWVLLEEGKLVPGSVEYGLLEQVSGQYLFFSSAEAKQKYWDDFDRYSQALNGLLKAANRR